LMATALTTVFLLEVGFSKPEIAAVTKVAGLIATIVGTLVGGALMTRIGTKRALWAFGILQATAGLSFILISVVGKNTLLLTAVISIENFMMGLGTAAISAFMMATCSRQFTATQFALLSSLTAVSRVVLVSQAGAIEERVGWTLFFVFSVVLALPGLLLLRRYDAWQSLERHILTLREKVQGLCFILGLGAIASDPFWIWVGRKDVGVAFAWMGALLVLAALITSFLSVPAKNSSI
jgi:MFS family permease